MVAPLASPSFFSGPRSELAVLDVYKVNNEKVVNSIQDITKAPDLTEVNALTGASVKNRVKDAFALLKAAKSLKDSKAGLLDKIFTGTGVLGEGLKKAGIPTNMLTAALTTGKSLGAIVTSAKGDITRIKNGNFTNISSISNAIGMMTGQEGLMKAASTQLQSGAIGSVVKLATQNGIPKSFSELTKMVDKNLPVINKVIGDVLPTVINKSDIKAMGEFAIASPGFTKATIPSAISDFSFGYSPGPAAEGKKPDVVWGEITATYTKVDPEWEAMSRKVDAAVAAMPGDPPRPPEPPVIIVVPDVAKIVEASPAMKAVIKEAVIPKATKTPTEIAQIAAENLRRKQEWADKMNAKYPSDDGKLRYFADAQVKSIWFPPDGWVQPANFNEPDPKLVLLPEN
jgi:hypothetical protein